MATRTIVKANPEQCITLGIQLWAKGTTPEEAIAWLKSISYTLNGRSYQATTVATAISTLNRINLGVTQGTVKATKAKGLYLNTK